MTPISITPELLIDLKDEIGNDRVMKIVMGSDRQCYIIVVSSHSIGEYPKKFRVIQTNGMYTTSHNFAIDSIQGLQIADNSHWVLLGHDKEYSGNLFVADSNGDIVSSFFVGEYVSEIQVTNSDEIWVCYDYLGVRGNPDLLEAGCCFFASQWNINSNKEFLFYPPHQGSFVNKINITFKNEVWMFVDDMEHPYLTKLVNKEVVDYWEIDLRYPSGFAIHENYVMFCGSHKDRLVYPLYELRDNQKMKHIADYQFFDDTQEDLPNNPLKLGHTTFPVARDSLIMKHERLKLYQIDLKTIVANL